MAERVVYLNGEYVPERDAKVSVLDRGFRWGDAVYDATRTFEGRLFKLGRSLAVGDFTIWSDGQKEPVAHATLTYSIPPKTKA